MGRSTRKRVVTPGVSKWLMALTACGMALTACADDRDRPVEVWEGVIDTTSGGAVEVHNPSAGIWDSTTAWRVEEELCIGSLEGAGPDLFGRIAALEVDDLGRIYVLESQSQELRVFDSTGSHVRTVGREGSGPGEFREAIGLAWAPDGNLWVVDPGNVRISVFDTAGTYLTMRRILGGYVMMPWPGRFDRAGNFYHYGLDLEADARFVMVRFDTLLQPLDTIRIPQPPQDRYFELETEHGFMTAGIPYTGNIRSRIGPGGHLWFANTSDYRVYERTAAGDTVLIISRQFERLPVTAEDVDSAIAGLDWFTSQGGKVDRSRFPSMKPAMSTMYIDDRGNLWVVPVTPAEDHDRVLDVFDISGRYLGRVRLPFRLFSNPIPIIRGGYIYGVTADEFDVPYVVRSRIVIP